MNTSVYRTIFFCSVKVKAAKYDIQKTSTCRATLFCSLFLVDVSRCFQRKIFPEKRPPCLFTFGYTRARPLTWSFKFVLANQMRVWANLFARPVASFMKTEKQIQILLLKVDPRFTFRSNFPQLATNVFVARQVDLARWKTGNIDQKQATKQCCATS